MGLGGATKKLQRVADMGEELYGKMNELREQVTEVRGAVQDTHERVAALENKVDQQGALLEALAEAEDIDVDRMLTEVAIEEAEPAITDAEDGTVDADAVEGSGDGDAADGSSDDVDTPVDDGAIGDAEGDTAASESGGE